MSAPRAPGVRKLTSSLPPKKPRAAAREGADKPANNNAVDRIAEAGDDGPLAARKSSVPDKQSFCVDILMHGYVQSFVDFFYLTHRPDPVAAATPDAAPAEINASVEDMDFMRTNLTQAESARRVGETATVYDCYAKLAQYFQTNRDFKTGIYFFEKCLEIARLTSDAAGEMKANHHLGLTHESVGDVAGAIRFHERHLQLAAQAGSALELQRAHKQLLGVYRAQAEALEAQHDLAAAADAHAKCLESCVAASDRQAEGLANYRMGRCFVLLNEPERALPFLEAYLSITKELADLEGTGAAHSALAAAHQALDHMEEAIAHLEQFLQVAQQTDNQQAQGEACCNLGVIFNRSGQFAKAVQYFERNFEICRNSVANRKVDRTVLDRARVNLGMARGNSQLGTYMHVINYDMTSLLKWKNRRVAFAVKR